MSLAHAVPAWTTRALCAQADPETWFPEKGRSNRQAKAICAACPVQAPCLAYSLANGERWGIWGGQSESDRRRLRPALAGAA